MVVEKVSGVDHVEKVEFCEDRERSFHPGIVGGRATGNLQLLRQDESYTQVNKASVTGRSLRIYRLYPVVILNLAYENNTGNSGLRG